MTRNDHKRDSIVLYCRGQNDREMEESANSQFKRIFECFDKLKERYMMKDLTPKVQESNTCVEAQPQVVTNEQVSNFNERSAFV